MSPITWVTGLTVVATGAHLAFWWLGASRLTKRLSETSAKAAPTRDPALLSIVLAARNEAANLVTTLPKLLAQDYRPLEVVACNDNSSDATGRVLAKAERQVSNVQLRSITPGPKQHPGKKQALAAAIAASTGEWLLATDADCAPSTDAWASHMMAARKPNTDIVLGYGSYLRSATPSWLNRWIRFEAVYTAVQYFSAALWGRPYMGVGRNLAYSRALYDAQGGFGKHAHLTSGDDDLLVNAAANALNTVVCLHPDAWTFSVAHTSWAAYARQKQRHLSVSTSYRVADQLWLGALAAAHVTPYIGLAVMGAHGRKKWAFGLYVVRVLGVWPRAATLLRGLGGGDLAPWWPVLDAAIAVYYLRFLGEVRPGAGKRSKWS